MDAVSHIRRQAQRKADLEMLPGMLAETIAGVMWWRQRLAVVTANRNEVAASDPGSARLMAHNLKVKQVAEILAVMEQDARQINRKIAQWSKK